MSIGSIAASGFSTAARPIPTGIKTVNVRDLPGTAERADRMIDAAVRGEESLKACVDGYMKKLQYDQDSLKRVSDIISNLPKDTSARDRASWSEELAGVKAEIADDQKHLELYQSAMANDQTRDRTLKFAGRLLGLSTEEVQKLFNERGARAGRPASQGTVSIDFSV